MDENETPEVLAKALKDATNEMKSARGELVEMQTELKGRYEKDESLTAEFKNNLDEHLVKFNEQAARVADLEQKLSASIKTDDKAPRSWGEQLVASDQFKNAQTNFGSLANRKNLSVAANVKQVSSVEAAGLIRQPHQDGLVTIPRDRFVMRDLLTVVPIDSPAVEYAAQTVRQNNATVVAEGAAKPYSEYAWESRETMARFIAHLTKITRQAMDDAPRLIKEIDGEMRYGLGYAEEAQILYGNGTGQNLHGIMPQAHTFAIPAGFALDNPAGAGVTRIDALRVAMVQVAVGGYPADGIVLNALDWAAIEMTKTNDGGYLFTHPQGIAQQRLWGLPVVATTAMQADDFLVGNFQMGATLYDRMAVEVLISTENVDDFEKNLATMRAEERIAIGVKRNYAFVKGQLSAAKAALA